MGVCREYRIGELAEATGVTRRTIHYYVGRGLLPTPEGAGLGTVYCDEHYYRILLIKKMQEAFLPLEEIRRRLLGWSLIDVKAQLAEGHIEVNIPRESSVSNGVRYERLGLGFNVELHYPCEGSPKTRELVDDIIQYVESKRREV